MPAVQFFTLLEEGEKMKGVELNLFYLNMCDLFQISNCTVEYYKTLREGYLANTGYVPPRPPAIDPADLVGKLQGI